MTVLPQATSRRELREREAAAEAPQHVAPIAFTVLPVGPPTTPRVILRSEAPPAQQPSPAPQAPPETAPPTASLPTPRPAPLPTSLPTPRLAPRLSPPARMTVPTPTPGQTRPVSPTRTTKRHAVVSKLLSVGALLFSAALAVGMSVPANAFSAASGTAASSSSVVNASGADAVASGAGADSGERVGIQSATVAADQTIDAGSRDGFQVLSWAQVLAQSYATITDYTYAGGKGSIRWPFVGHAEISSPYGPRAPLCASCTSSFHSGTDFLPGVGAPIFAIANGVVTDHTEGVTDLGNNVTITHKIGRDTVTSTYGHMQAGSSPLVVGQAIHVGDFVGLVGQTGEATGPHLHLGITVNGAGTDPVPWMEAHVN